MNKRIAKALNTAGHTTLLPIQEKTIDTIDKFESVVLQSATGSGKTLAFLLSILNRLDSSKNELQALVIAPTRELALQIDDVYRSLKSGFHASTCYGGKSMRDEKNSLSENPALIIGTPGRLCDHIRRENIVSAPLDMLVIDEFDKCLEMGFSEEMRFIVETFPKINKKLLTSATELAEYPDYLELRQRKVIQGELNSELSIRDWKIEHKGDAFNELVNTLAQFSEDKSMVFVNYREVAEDVSDRLYENGIVSVCYHGGLEQDERERALIKFSNGTVNTIVCTDLGARGLDIPDVQHVFHFQHPGSEDAFIHRRGRTGRMGSTGNTYLFVSEETQLPEYVPMPEEEFAPKKGMEPTPLKWETLYISAGKKEKVNKIDIVGFLSKVGRLKKDQIGLIHVKDHRSYVAIDAKKFKHVLGNIRQEKIKGKRVRFGKCM